MADFHFLRPEWLLAAPLAPLLAWWLWRRLTRLDPWQMACDSTLLPHLRERSITLLSQLPFVMFAGLGALIALTLAGPAWDATEAAIHRTMRARVVALDLSRSMDATDVVPSRMTVARAKTAEIYRRTTDDQVGLVVFAGEGFFIAPLSSDPASLIGILSAFSPAVITAQGSRPDLGLREAGWLVRRAGAAGGEIVLITDGATGGNAVGAARRLFEEDGIRVSVLAVGTEAGGRIPLPGGGYMRNLSGREIVAVTSMPILRDIAAAGGGRFVQASEDYSDVGYLLDVAGPAVQEGAIHDTGKSLSVWLDRGPWFAVLLLPLATLAFRRGWVFLLPFTVALPLIALTWTAPVLAAGDEVDTVPAQSEEGPAAGGEVVSPRHTGDWRWQAIDLYRDGRYVEAAALFGEGRRPSDHYNRGNALARAGFYRAAVAAYVQAISLDAENADARFNRALVESLLDEQQRQSRAAAGEGRGGSGTQGDAETSGSGEGRGDDDVQASAAPAEEADDAGDGPVRPGERERAAARPRPLARAGDSQAEQAELERQRVQAGGPASQGNNLSGAQMERLEDVLEELTEQRLGLWRRKIEQQWRNNPRRGLAQSDAW